MSLEMTLFHRSVCY